MQRTTLMQDQSISLNPAWPYLYFNGTGLVASPFEIAEHKLHEPGIFSIAETTQRLLDRTVTNVTGDQSVPEKEGVTWTTPPMHSTSDPDDTH